MTDMIKDESILEGGSGRCQELGLNALAYLGDLDIFEAEIDSKGKGTESSVIH